MSRTLTTILAAAAVSFCGSTAMAQTSGNAGAQAGASANVQENGKRSGQTSGLAQGTTVNAELNQSVDSKKVKVGDTVTARTTETVKVDGKPALPKGTKLIGHVTRASARAKGDANSELAVQFDRAELKGGHEMALRVNVQALAAAQEATPIGGDDLQAMGTTSSGTAARRGSMAGTATGGLGGTVGGAASGAASTVPRTVEGATGAVNTTVNDTAGAATHAGVGGLNGSGQLTSTSRGVFGLNGLGLDTSAANATQGSVITSAGKSVHLDSGTRMLLVTQAETSASAQR